MKEVRSEGCGKGNKKKGMERKKSGIKEGSQNRQREGGRGGKRNKEGEKSTLIFDLIHRLALVALSEGG